MTNEYQSLSFLADALVHLLGDLASGEANFQSEAEHFIGNSRYEMIAKYRKQEREYLDAIRRACNKLKHAVLRAGALIDLNAGFAAEFSSVPPSHVESE